jgi:hypothetical protein
MRELGPGARHPLQVRFAPEHRGSFDAVLDVTLDNGVNACGPEGTETYSVKLHGAAKYSDDLPPASERPAQPRMANEGPIALARIREPPPGLAADMKFYNDEAVRALGTLAKKQSSGADTVKESAGDYKPASKDDAFWGVMVDVALAMALGGIAGAVGKSLAKKLAMTLGGSGSDGPLLNSLVDIVKDGIKTSGKGVVAQVGSLKSNDVHAFFRILTDALIQVQDRAGTTLNIATLKVRKVAETDPALALSLMRDLVVSIETHNETAKHEQKSATLAQWMSGLARLDAGTRDGGAIEGKRALATDPTGAVKLDDKGELFKKRFKGVRGTLQLRVEVDGPLEDGLPPPFMVRHADVDGIAPDLAHELVNADLRTFPIPIWFFLKGGWLGRIMRDELGVIHTESGDFHEYQGEVFADSRRTAAEKQEHQQQIKLQQAQRHRAANELVARILSTPLSVWNLDGRS